MTASTTRRAIEVAVVVATCNRSEALANRCLASVVAQTRPPDHLVVIDDSSLQNRTQNHRIVDSIDVGLAEVLYLENARTRGASGSWNTAIYTLHELVTDPASLFVAILDDDDAWAPDYLERCLELVREHTIDMVGADIVRHEPAPIGSQPTPAPESLCASDFLTANPGIQGSNLFARLSVFLAAGGFDEGLRSTTDRDLCIRIADLGKVRYRRLPTPLVHHFADTERARLSTRGSTAKLEGLTKFWQKYRGRMSATQQAQFCERASRLFDWQLTIRTPARQLQRPCAAEGPTLTKMAVVLGLRVDNNLPQQVLEVVRELRGWLDTGLVGLDVVLLEAGADGATDSLLDRVAAEIRNMGAGCYRFSLKRQANHARDGLFDDWQQVSANPATSGRAMLQRYVQCVAKSRIGAVAWMVGAALQERDSEAETQADSESFGIHDALRRIGAERLVHQATPCTNLNSRTCVEEALVAWIAEERATSARHRVIQVFGPKQLRLLGRGSEAVVFTDEHTVYKCIDYWKTRMPESQLRFLRSQVDQWNDVPGLYGLKEVVVDGSYAILTYDFEPSTQYVGGHEHQLVQLLVGCRRAGIVCNNVHPKNLIVTATGVKLIDYGADIHPWTALGFEHMARRAFLACRYAHQPELETFMTRALTEPNLEELKGFEQFRRQLVAGCGDHSAAAPSNPPFALYVGIISAEPDKLRGLLEDVAGLHTLPAISKVAAVVLENGGSAEEMDRLVQELQGRGQAVTLITERQQRSDAVGGAFGDLHSVRDPGQVSIARARTMVQRYVGALQAEDETAVSWILDDDMRLDERARSYVPWLPVFRQQGVDVLLGQYTGSSPNPPLNGIRVQLVDLVHNLGWLHRLAPDAELPDRSAENQTERDLHEDYYYDLSRKHYSHLEMPHWLEPAYEGETVRQARDRICLGALGILSGAPLTRPLTARMPDDPPAAARNSVNRGGCTFVFNHRALTQTPNAIVELRGGDARRSDMMWSILNRHYRQMNVKQVSFPILHFGRVTPTPDLNLPKVIRELVGAAFYGGLTEFLRDQPHHNLDFTELERGDICQRVEKHLNRRLHALDLSFHRIRGLTATLRGVSNIDALGTFRAYLESWFTPQVFAAIRAGTQDVAPHEFDSFLSSLRDIADDYAEAAGGIDDLRDRLLLRHQSFAYGGL